MNVKSFRALIQALGLFLCVSFVWAGGAQDVQEKKAADTAATSQAASAAKESPMLAELVKAGKLPPLEQRLPENPYVATTFKEIGMFGGTLRGLHPSPDRLADIGHANQVPILDSYVEEVSPGVFKGNIIETCTVSDDSKVFTFNLRKGMKWSDGEPLTAEDFQFAWEDIIMNEKLTPVFPKILTVGGEKMQFEVVDEYTVRYTSPEAYGGFVYQLAFWMRDYNWMLQPKHYMKQFHAKYTSMEALNTLIRQASLNEGEWWTLFNQMKSLDSYNEDSMKYPTLSPWIVKEVTPQEVVLERNPYYHKVDREGKQLPYIDMRRSTLVADSQTAVLKVIAGEVDYIRTLLNISDLPIIKENEAKAGYTTYVLKNDVIWVVVLNLSHEDQNWREVVSDVRFRRAINYAINRQEVLDIAASGVGSFPNITPSQYDPEKANALLDEMGMTDRDADGYRLGPDGARFTIPFEVAKLWGYEPPVTELLLEYFRNIGIHATMKVVEFGQWAELGESNRIKASTHWANQPSWKLNPVAFSEYLPDQYRSWGPAWRDWYNTNGKSGSEPPEEVKRIFELYEVINVGNEQQRQSAINEIVKSYMDNIWMIGLAWTGSACITNKDIGNVKADGIAYMFYEVDGMYYKK